MHYRTQNPAYAAYPRLSFGRVRGYPMNGTRAPYMTTIYGLFDRALGFDKSGDWTLPQRFWERKDDLDLATPANFVCDCDIIGGNSGSPVLNRDAELVGVIFDGNIESLAGNYVYDAERNRAVAVHAAYILHALRTLYDAEKLAAELVGETKKGTTPLRSGSGTGLAPTSSPTSLADRPLSSASSPRILTSMATGGERLSFFFAFRT